MDVGRIALRSLSRAALLFAKDLEALPADAFGRSLGGKARTVADIVTEVNLVNDHLGMLLRGEEPFAWPEGDWIRAMEEHSSKEAIQQAFDASVKRLIQTAEGFGPADWEKMSETEQGKRTALEAIQFATLHLWYHSGQLNFIQTLLGDDDWHW